MPSIWFMKFQEQIGKTIFGIVKATQPVEKIA
jgi:hypothetical protein